MMICSESLHHRDLRRHHVQQVRRLRQFFKKAKSQSPARFKVEESKDKKVKDKKKDNSDDEAKYDNEPGQSSNLPIQDESSPELIPDVPEGPSLDPMPVNEEDEEEGEEESRPATDDTIPYSGNESLFASDVHIDEAEWEQLPAALKIALKKIVSAFCRLW